VGERGFGIRLRSYEFEDRELLVGIDRLLGDTELHARLAGISSRLASVSGTHRAAGLIEQLATTPQPIRTG
jgi:hypothetical protein